MISLKKFVEINGKINYEDLNDEEKAYWKYEYEESMRYDQSEEKGKNTVKYGI